MAVRRHPDDPWSGQPGDLIATSLRLMAQAPRPPARDERDDEETGFPAVDIYETPDELVIEAELPGVDPAAVAVTATEAAVVVEGTKAETLSEDRVNFLCMERLYGEFRRVVPLGRAVDITRAHATCREGLLRIRIPRVQEKRGRLRAVPVEGGVAPAGGEAEP